MQLCFQQLYSAPSVHIRNLWPLALFREYILQSVLRSDNGICHSFRRCTHLPTRARSPHRETSPPAFPLPDAEQTMPSGSSGHPHHDSLLSPHRSRKHSIWCPNAGYTTHTMWVLHIGECCFKRLFQVSKPFDEHLSAAGGKRPHFRGGCSPDRPDGSFRQGCRP